VSAEPAALAGERHWREGLALADARQWAQAARVFARATRSAPQDPVYWLNLAHAHRRSGRLSRAVAAARRCLRLAPADPLARCLEAECLAGMNRHAEAAQAYARIEADGQPGSANAVLHATSLLALRQPKRAAAVLLRALARQPADRAAHLLLAEACRDQGLKREAVECLKTVLALDPGDLQARSRLSYEKRHLCDWADHATELARLQAELENAAPGALRFSSVFGLLSLPLPPALHLRAAQADAAEAEAGVQPLPARLPAAPLATAAPQAQAPRIRLGWLSYDFRDHPVAKLLHDLLARIDRQRFEVVLYAIGPGEGSPWRTRLVAVADRFVDLCTLSDRHAAERIRADAIDLLIDLMGHTRGHRMGVLAHRPAPVQVAFLGFPGSTGAGCIDYLIGDALVTPLELAPLYSEKLAQMPICFQPNGRGRPLPQPMQRAQAGLPEDAFVMCAFNHPYKILPETFDIWCAVMRELPHAVLWLRETNHQLRDNVRREAARRGIAPERLCFAGAVSYADHFSRLALADLFVDTWPYNAHTTASDALWAGVPVVTRYGQSFASRVAASVLHSAGLVDLAFDNNADYQRAIVLLAQDAELRSQLRSHLVEQRMSLPLFDAALHARHFEALAERMWARWQAGLPCDHLPARG
jgi:tetratricopeptide (TPR) repeat protein